MRRKKWWMGKGNGKNVVKVEGELLIIDKREVNVQNVYTCTIA